MAKVKVKKHCFVIEHEHRKGYARAVEIQSYMLTHEIKFSAYYHMYDTTAEPWLIIQPENEEDMSMIVLALSDIL